jgi:copper chaperone CopZ
MNDVKEDINTNEEVKEIKEAKEITQPVENVQPVEEETKVNIDPDSIKNDSTVISDDEFFDDFFGDE